MHLKRMRALGTVAIFIAVTGIAAAVLWQIRDRQFGVHEDHFDKGVLLHETGSMSLGSQPMVFRPPGYPAFVATTLYLRDAAFSLARPFGIERPAGGRLVMALVAQAVLLGVLGAAIFWFAVDRAGAFTAAACAIGIACNPVLLIIAGFVSYPLLHIVVLSIATLMLIAQAGSGAPDAGASFRNGIVWGVATLVKSVTLVAPAFIFLWAGWHNGLQKAARTTLAFTAGLLLVVAPWTVRNFVETGRFIPVNAQASFALWATSLERIPSGAGYLRWVDIWWASGMKTYTEVTGAATNYSPAVFEDHVLELGDRFGELAAENLRRDPMVFAYNALHNSVMFVIELPTAFWLADDAFRWPTGSGTARIVAGLSFWLMTAIATMAAVIGCARRDPRWTLIVALFLMMWAAHSLTFLEARYLYIKVPTIIAAFVLTCAEAPVGGERGRRMAASAAALVAILSIVGLFAL